MFKSQQAHTFIIMKKSKFDSFCVNGFAEGCKYCVKGRKLVLLFLENVQEIVFIVLLAIKEKMLIKHGPMKRECKNIKEMIKECVASQARGRELLAGSFTWFV